MPDCKTCKENKVADVPYIVHETEMARAETSRRPTTNRADSHHWCSRFCRYL